MIDKVLAQKLVSRISKHIKNRVNIIDENGIIIASSDHGFVGVLHKCAQRLMDTNTESAFVTENEAYMGAKAGVNLTFFYKDEPIGVMGLAGEPSQELMELGKAVRLSVESMIEYELLKNEMNEKKDEKNKFISMLLYENVDDEALLGEAALEIGYQAKLPRVPILVDNCKAHIDAMMQKVELAGQDDITYKVHPGLLLILKSVPKNKAFQHNTQMGVFLTDLLQGKEFPCYVGVAQKSFKEYAKSFETVTWLRNFLRQSSGVHFLTDNLSSYIYSKLSKEYGGILFGQFAADMEPSTRENFMFVVGALLKSNMSINEAAKWAKTHRNTLVFRLNKIRDELGIDPINSFADQRFVDFLYHYLKANHLPE